MVKFISLLILICASFTGTSFSQGANCQAVQDSAAEIFRPTFFRPSLALKQRGYQQKSNLKWSCQLPRPRGDVGCIRDASRLPFGDIYFMRGHKENVPADFSDALSVAFLSQDWDFSKEKLLPWTSGEDVRLIGIANIALAHLAFLTSQDNGHVNAKPFVAAGRLASGLEPAAQADLAYMEALTLLKEGALQKSLDSAEEAIKLDKSFFNAHFLRLTLLLKTGAQGNIGEYSSCIRDLDKLFLSLNALIEIQLCPYMAIQLQNSLLGRAPPVNASEWLVVAYLGYFSRNLDAFQHAENYFAATATINNQCSREVASELAIMKRDVVR